MSPPPCFQLQCPRSTCKLSGKIPSPNPYSVILYPGLLHAALLLDINSHLAAWRLYLTVIPEGEVLHRWPGMQRRGCSSPHGGTLRLGRCLWLPRLSMISSTARAGTKHIRHHQLRLFPVWEEITSDRIKAIRPVIADCPSLNSSLAKSIFMDSRELTKPTAGSSGQVS